MKILIKQFLGKSHSWAVCGWGIATGLIRQGHEVHLFSTDGLEHLPSHLKNNVVGYTQENRHTIFGSLPDKEYDSVISYTCMKNFPHYLQYAPKNRFGIWAWEWAGQNSLPTGFAKHYQSCDFLCAPSSFSKRVFMDSKIPEDRIKVITHGIGEEYRHNSTIPLPTTKKVKILANIAQNHLRKNIPGLLEAYGKAFNNKDDVCLILKSKDKPVVHPFDVSLQTVLKEFKSRFPRHAEIKVFSNFVEDISSLYRSVDIIYSLSHCEGFYFPGLEGIASGKMSIAPNWGGQLDFLNSSNSLLVEGKETRANPQSMYWESKNSAIWFSPSTDDAAAKLRLAVANYQKINAELEKQREQICDDYSWDSVAQQFLKLFQ